MNCNLQQFFVEPFEILSHTVFSFFDSVTNWSNSSKGGFIDTGYVGYVQIDAGQRDCLIVEAEMSNCAGSTPMYAVEAYVLCHSAVEEITCIPDSTTGTIIAKVVKSSDEKFQSLTTQTLISDLLEGIGNTNVTIDVGESDKDALDGATRGAVILFFKNGKVNLNFC